MTVGNGADQGWKTAPFLRAIGDVIVISCNVADGTAVCATLNADDAAAGEPVMNCLSALLPAEATVSTPTFEALSTASDRSSSNGWPYGEPSDMLMMSTRSRMSPSPLGSSAKSMPWISATPLHDVAGAEQALTAYDLCAREPHPAAGDDVGDVRAVTAESRGIGCADRIRIGLEEGDPSRRRVVRPAFADEVVASDHLGAREQAVVRRRRPDRRPPGSHRWSATGWPVNRPAEAAPRQLHRPPAYRDPERGVRVVDAAVDDGDAHAPAIRAECMCGCGADVRNRVGQIDAVVRHTDHARDRRIARDLRQIGRVHVQHHGVEHQLHRGTNLGTGRNCQDATDDGGLFGGHVRAAARIPGSRNRMAAEAHQHVVPAGESREARMQHRRNCTLGDYRLGYASALRRAVLSMVIGRGPEAAATVAADNNALHTANVRWP